LLHDPSRSICCGHANMMHETAAHGTRLEANQPLAGLLAGWTDTIRRHG
jgi:hypothetical protein